MLFKYIRMFYGEIGNRMVVLFVLILLAAFFEAISIGMILPLLQTDDTSNDSILGRALAALTDTLGVGTGTTSILVLMTVFFFIRGAFMVGQAMFQAKIIADHLIQMRTAVITALFHVRFRYFISHETGFFTNAVAGELERVNFSLRQLGVLAVWTITAIVYLTLAVLFQPIISLFVLVLVIPIGIIAIIVNRKTKEAAIQRSIHAGQHESLLVEAVQHAKYIMATGRSGVVTARIISETRRLGQLYQRLMRLGSISEHGFEPFAVLVLAGIVWYYTQILNQPITEVIFLVVLFFQGSKSVLAVQPAYRKFLQSAGSLGLYQNLTRELAENARKHIQNPVTPNTSADIDLTNVTVSYPGKDQDALSDVTIQIPARKTIAFVGPSGSGKSTIANLLTGLIDPTSGEITLGGEPYSNLDINVLQSKIAYVTQESVIFQGTALDNVTMWDASSNISLAKQLLTNVRLEHLLHRTQDEQETQIRSTGTDISGGERQRLFIARELYRPFDLLILDEATSSLDSKSETRIDELLRETHGKSTIIVIAHRLSTIRHADVIYVLDSGRIVESGTYDELTKLGGIFTKMVMAQSL